MVRKAGVKDGRVQIGTNHKIRQLVELLEFEIGRIQSAQSNRGWTAWALVVSIASALWVLLAELEKGDFTWKTSLLVFLGLWTGLEVYRSVSALVSRDAGGADLFFQHVSHLMLPLLYALGTSIAVFAIASYCKDILHPVIVYAIYTVCVWNALVLMIGFLVLWRRSEFRVVVAAITKSSPVGSLIVLVSGSIALLGIVLTVWHGFVIPTPSDYRVGGILFGIGVILMVLLSVSLESPMRDTLVQIRRNIGLGKLHVAAARNEVEVALIGLSISTMLQQELNELLSLGDELSSRTMVLADDSDKLTDMAIIRRDETERGQAVAVPKDLIKKHIREVDAVGKDFDRKFAVFSFHVGAVSQNHPELLSDITRLLGSLSGTMKKRRKAVDMAKARVLRNVKRSLKAVNG